MTGYFRVRIQTITPMVPTTFDLYLLINGHITLYLHAGDSLSKEKLETLARKDNFGNFLVKNADRDAYKNYVRKQINSDSISVGEKALVLRESAIGLIEELYEHPDVNVALQNSKPIIGDFLSFMDSDPEAMSQMISISSHDFYTYNHSLDVSIYSLGLGAALGFNKEQLEELGLGALFHDVGKRNVPIEILCKKGPLDDAEWIQMQNHPQYGLIILNACENISDAMKACCFEHHESWMGNGYPQQLTAEEIHPMARIVAIADTYDAMTTQRSYNTPLSPRDAVTLMRDKVNARFDPDMLKALTDILFKLGAT